MRKYFWVFMGGVATGAVAAGLIVRHKDKVKPLAAGLLAKGMRLRDKAMSCAARTAEQAEDVMAEARHINKTAPEE